MLIKLYINKKDFNSFTEFYDKVNNEIEFEKNEIPNVDLHITIPTKNDNQWVEFLLYYDIYKSIKFFLDKKE